MRYVVLVLYVRCPICYGLYTPPRTWKRTYRYIPDNTDCALGSRVRRSEPLTPHIDPLTLGYLKDLDYGDS